MKQIAAALVLAFAAANAQAAVTELWMQSYIKSCTPATGIVHSNPFYAFGHSQESFDYMGSVLVVGNGGQRFQIQVTINGAVVWDNLGVGVIPLPSLANPGDSASVGVPWGFTTYQQYTGAGNNTLSVIVNGNVLVCNDHMKVQRYSW